jgi:hypothetical protein
MAAAVYQAGKVAELFEVSEFTVYEAARRGEGPIGELAIRVGHRRVVWPKAPIDRLLGIDGLAESK